MSQWIDPDYRGEEDNGQESEEEFAPPDSPPQKKLKSGESKFSNFAEEDLLSFAARGSVEQRKAVEQCLSSEEGKVIGILTKMQDDRSNAIHRRFNGLNKQVWSKFELIDEALKRLDKLEGMSKFTYAWCKSAQEANVFKLKQKY